MGYLGGKSRISKQLSEFLNSELKPKQPFVDLFCGSCNVISKIDDNRLRIANDKHLYLIEMFRELQNGWIPPENISEEEYVKIKSLKDENIALAGFVGFSCSFSGKWWGGYARNSRNDNFCLQSRNSILNKMKTLNNVEFLNFDYKDVNIPKGSLVYCDIPYKGTTQYCTKEVGVFNYDEFYDWIKQNKNNFSVYVSEYKHNMPEGFKIIWQCKSNKEMRNKDNLRIETEEILFNLD